MVPPPPQQGPSELSPPHPAGLDFRKWEALPFLGAVSPELLPLPTRMSQVRKRKDSRPFPPRSKLKMRLACGQGPSPPTIFQRRMRRSAPPVARRLLLGPKRTALTSERWASCGEKGRSVPLVLATHTSLLTLTALCHASGLCSNTEFQTQPHQGSSPLTGPLQQPPAMFPILHYLASWSPGLLSLPHYKMPKGSHHKLWEENSCSQ